MQQQKLYTSWLQQKQEKQKALAVLIDPDKAKDTHLEQLCQKANQNKIDYFFIGGSLLSTQQLDHTLSFLKKNCSIPLVLFPGSTNQINEKADAILLLSLLSGRNADLLIGKHVEVAFQLHQSSLEKISTSYLLIDGGKPTAVNYISHTLPIPANKPQITLATALAGEMLGMQCTYLEAGSGAENSVSVENISQVSQHSKTPLIVGGGIRHITQAQKAFDAGADIIVVGTKIESQAHFIDELANLIQQQNTSV